MLFDNKTKDEIKRLHQVKELLSLVNMVSSRNGGKPYSNEIFSEIKVKLILILFLLFKAYTIAKYDNCYI